MFENARVIRLVPDKPGRGGIKTGVSTFVTNPDVRDVYNVYIYNARWRKMIAERVLAGVDTQTVDDVINPLVLHNFALYGTTPGAAATNHVLAHYANISTGVNYLADCNHVGGGILKTIASVCTPAVFTNIKNRCFICCGGASNFIYNGTTVYDVGIETPTIAALYSFSSGSTGTCTVTNSCSYITYLTGTAWSSANIGAQVTLNGLPYLITNFLNSGYSTPGTSSGASGNPYLTISGAWPTDGSFNGLTISISGHDYIVGSYTISGSVTTVQLRSNLATSPSSTAYTLSGIQFVLATSYSGTSAWSSTYALNTGNLAWAGQGPEYAYCYYDTVTGHISNGSPITYVTEQNQKNVQITLSNITTPLPESGGIRFNRILVFRTLLQGGSILYPFNTTTAPLASIKAYITGTYTFGGGVVTLGGGAAFEAAGTPDPRIGNLITLNGTNYTIATINTTAQTLTLTSGSPSASGSMQWPATGTRGTTGFIDSYTDSNLIPQLQIPQVTNNQPPTFMHQAYWDGRVWGNGTADPSAVYFSGDIVQIPFGVAEECYPTNNVLRISAEDGRVTGMRVVGSYLLIVTDRYTYYVAGTNETNYRLLKFSSTMYGLHDYQFVELAGETTDSEPQVVYLGCDWKIYAFSPSTGSTQIIQPIQDKLDIFGNPYQSIVTTDALGTGVTWVSGAQFSQNWVGQQIYINGFYNSISSVTDNTTLVLTGTAGTHSNIAMTVCPVNLIDVRMGQIATQGAKWIVISIPIPSAHGSATIFVYDYENKVWLKEFPLHGTQGNMPFTVQYQNNKVPKLLYMGTEGTDSAKVYHWPDLTYTTTTTGAFLDTGPMDFDRKSQKMLAFVRIYACGVDSTNLAAHPFTVYAQKDDGTGYSTTAPYNYATVDAARALVPYPQFAVDSPNISELTYHFPWSATGFTPGYAHRWRIKVTLPEVNLPMIDVLAMDVAVVDEGDPGVTEP
jgi:hypothetical protein